MLKIEKNYSLKKLNTFAINSYAELFARVENIEDLQQLVSDKNLAECQKFILGQGSNILLPENFSGLVVKIELQGIEKIKEDEEHVWLKIAAGESWHQLVLYCIAQGFAGIENLSLIPGTVGAAPIQNIGAYGVELKDTFVALTAMEITTGALAEFTSMACQFGYRDSVFKRELKGQYVITSIVLKLNKIPRYHTEYGEIKNTLQAMGVKELSLSAISTAVIALRTRKLPDPMVIPNAGSFFKNPIISRAKLATLQQSYPTLPHYTVSEKQAKIPAAWLIETCGWKGKVLGGAGVHSEQALVLVNLGGANAGDILKLANCIQEDVSRHFQIELEMEVAVV